MLSIATSDAPAVMECYAAIKVFVAAVRRPAVYTLVNFAPDAVTAADVHARIAEACQRFLGLNIGAAGDVPVCERTGSADGVLVYGVRARRPARSIAWPTSSGRSCNCKAIATGRIARRRGRLEQ